MVFILTGGPGFGKTTVIQLLEQLGIPVCHENARELSHLMKVGRVPDEQETISPFEKQITAIRLGFLLDHQADPVAFSDRGLPDQLAYSRYRKKSPTPYVADLVARNRYAETVFVAPPWQEIFVNDEHRQESFQEALAIHNCILQTYRELGYKLIELPLVNPQARVNFIRDYLSAGFNINIALKW
ncbi:MAG: ATP-binding protein [Marinilabiliales bacterium]|nr:ATP-binding protein [Marinilabiliales bacterium]